MSILPETADDAPEPIWRLSVDQYHEMMRAGILTDDDPVELLDGCLVTKMVKYPPHTVGTRLVRNRLASIAPQGYIADSQAPITLSASEPEPDVILVRGEEGSYTDSNPGPRDVALVVEVADTSLHRDRGIKKRLYAEAGIPAYWIVDFEDGCLEVFTEPSGPADRPDDARAQVFRPGDSAPVVIEGREVGGVGVKGILP